MRLRSVSRFLCTLVAATGPALAAASCGSSGHVSADAGPDASLSDGAPSDGSVFLENDASLCHPLTCQSQGFTCGKNGDGCGGTIDCGTCAAPDYCGGGGYSACGHAPPPTQDAGPCPNLKTCQDLGYDCGPAADGCGGLLQCGTCAAPAVCGAGGFDKCDALIDGGTCVAKTCQDLGFECGQAGDGCGGTIDCGACTAPQTCGGGGFNKCGILSLPPLPDGGPAPVCIPKTCLDLGYNCGVQGDGCGGTVDCGTCTAPQYCGAASPSVCGVGPGLLADGGCRPKTCQDLGYNCGPAGDGCGNALDCGSCTAPNICGGGGQPGVCGRVCTGLCTQQSSCSGGTPTTITGRVVSGTTGSGFGQPDPVPNVLVYVPNGPLLPISAGASCGGCQADVSGTPLVSTTTAFDGTFVLPNVPVGQGIPVVIQLGRWRRGVTFDILNSCTSTNVGDIHMPRTQGGDAGDIPGSSNIPLTAISTGALDPIECVLLKMGVAQSEFSTNATNSRIHLYQGNGAGAGGVTPNEAALMDTGGSFMNYDQILLPCWGVDPVANSCARKSATELADLVTYANAGGRFFATHFSYAWLYQNPPFNQTANFNVDQADIDSMTANVSMAVPPRSPGVFSQWLATVGALSNTSPPQLTINQARHDVDSVAGNSVDWVDGPDPCSASGQVLLHYTFDTPVGAPSTCGHAIFSDFHVNTTSSGGGTSCGSVGSIGCPSGAPGATFPAECGAPSPLTSQERVLEFMIWDLESCSGPIVPPCNKRSCQDQNIQCGPAGDGCGGALDCGPCTAPQTCGGGGTPFVCGAPPDGGPCQPQTCGSQHIQCGPAGDGCGNLIAGGCGNCAPPQVCGGGGVAGQCAIPDAGPCVPKTCQELGLNCGPAGDGCGNLIPNGCGTCTPPQTCGGGGVPGVCGAPTCTPKTCHDQSIQCGPAGDGCGNSLDCGPCPPGQACGAGGVPGQCAPFCVPKTCKELGFNCGPAGDGCGNLIQCGSCTLPQTCGGGGLPGICGGGTQ
jgi:hypothetical protein